MKKNNKANGKVVFFIAHMELPDINALAHRVLANCMALREAGYKPVLIGYSKDPGTSKNIKETHFKVHGFDCYNVPYPISNLDWFKDTVTFRKMTELISEYLDEGVHSIVCNNIGVTNFYGLMCFAKKHNIHMVSDTEDWFDVFAGNIIRRTYKKLDDEIYNTKLKPRIKNVITITSFINDYYVNTHHCNCIIVPSLTYKDDPRFNGLAEYKTSDCLRYVFSGNPGYRGYKDQIDWCVIAFSRHAPVNSKFDIFGVTLSEFLEQFPEYTNEATDKRITFHGFKSNRVCLEKIASADFAIFARSTNQVTKASFPTKFSESQKIGTPTITTPAGDTAQYIIDGVNGLISEEPTYESFEKTFRRSCEMKKDEILLMHENCKKDDSLEHTNYVTILKDYFDNLK